mmetsp:Transcript_113/g.401  ORF Transcript_113/g.401 Transcript_113/m.401 type:complete len:363 (-) Transcript_113:987-2075(-)
MPVLGRLVEAADVGVCNDEVLLAADVVAPGRAVPVDVHGPEAVDGVRREPVARVVLRGLAVGLLRAHLGRLEEGHHDQDQEAMDGHVGHSAQKCGRRRLFRGPRYGEEVVQRGARLDDEGSQDDAVRDGHHRARAQVRRGAGELEAWNGAEHAVVVHEVDVAVGGGKGEEGAEQVAAGEEEDHGRDGHVQRDVGVPAEVHLRHVAERALGREAHNVRVRTHQELRDVQRQQRREDGLDDEGNEEARREAVPLELVAERLLHGVGVEELHVREGLEPPAIVGPHRVDQRGVGRVVGDNHVEDDVQPAGKHVQDEVRHLHVLLVLEAGRVGDPAAQQVHELVPQDDQDHEGEARRRGRRLARGQ